MEVLADAESRLRDAASKKTLVEVSLLRAIEARNAVSIDTLLKRLGELRTQPEVISLAPPTTIPQPPAPQPGWPPPVQAASRSPSFRESPATASTAPSPVASAPLATAGEPAGLDDLWSRVLDAVGRASQFTKSYLLEAHPVGFDRKVFTIGFDPEFEEHIGLVDNSRTHTILQTKLHELGHPGVQIKFIKHEAPVNRTPPTTDAPAQAAAQSTASPTLKPELVAAPANQPRSAKPASGAASKEDFKNDPLIKKALEVFRGRIVDVRG
jgi:DNA polymerase-3 subunit gamma/tau